MLARSPISANIPAHDFKRARQWYEEKLGLTPVIELPPGGVIYAPGGVAFVLYETAFAGTGKHTLATFTVDDLDAAMAELRANGVVFEEYDLGDKGPTTVNGVSRDPDGLAAAWFKDSEDNILSVAQLPPGVELPKLG
jgi:catechol 2,3-dioxygenase-like lactoylglutathione lyase family enzyme